MDIKAYLDILWRQKWVIVLSAIAAVVVAAAGTMRETPIYTATVTMRLMTPAGQNGYVEHGSMLYAERLMNTYSTLVKTAPILDDLRAEMGIEETSNNGSIASRIGVGFPGNSELMQLHFEDSNPEFAATLINTLGNIMVDEGRNSNIGRYYTLAIVDPAQPPSSPSSPNLPFNLVFGLVLGVIGGLGLSVLIEVMDTGLHSTSRIVEATSVPALGRIPALDKQQPSIFLNGSSPLSESFRQLRTTLFALGSDAPLKTLLVTSAQVGEGKSTIVSNLAYSMGHSGRQVVVVDGNLRRPTLHELFNVPNRLGLSNILTREVSLDEALQDSGLPGIQVLTSGPLPPHPAFLLDSHYMMELLDMLSERFDMVLIDSPPLLEFADTSVLALSAKNVLMVVERSQARQESLRGALQKLDEIKIEPLGLVVNRAEPTTQEAVSQMAILKSFKSLGQRKASQSKTS